MAAVNIELSEGVPEIDGSVTKVGGKFDVKLAAAHTVFAPFAFVWVVAIVTYLPTSVGVCVYVGPVSPSMTVQPDGNGSVTATVEVHRYH